MLHWDQVSRMGGDSTPVNQHIKDKDKARLKVLVADDFQSMQQALVTCLDALPDFQVVGIASNGSEALQISADVKPDVVIAGLQMPVMDGFRLMRELRRSYPGIHLIA